MAAPVAFAGRGGELSQLAGALGREARLLLVTGDAGVGKTRLVGEGMARAAAAGMVVARGECLPLAGELPLWPVAAALGELGRVEGGAVLAAALAAVPGYVRAEAGRLLPQLGTGGEAGPGAGGEGWRRERLFSAVAGLLEAVARDGRAGVVIEDVHWADTATLDLLTFLARPGGPGGVSVVVTCRSDEVPLAPAVAGWLAHVRSGAGVEEIALGPLSRAEVAAQVAGLAGGAVPPGVVEELYARAEGNPFFTEQLVAAALAGPAPAGMAGGALRVPAGLPVRLAELLAARAGRCGPDAGAVLAALAVAGRPLGEHLLEAVTGLEAGRVRGGLRELAARRLLAGDAEGGGYRPRHALLAEAVAAGLLPGERAGLHERTARALGDETLGDETLAAEVAAHWQAAGRPAEELSARAAAAAAAERVFGYAEAAAHWQRAIELCQAQPEAAGTAGLTLPRLYVRATDALELSGDGVQAGELAGEAYRRFADHPDQLTAAVICHRAARYREIQAHAAALPLIREALRLFEQAPRSVECAEAWYYYASVFVYTDGSPEARLAALTRALEVAEAAGATALVPRILSRLGHDAFARGQAEKGAALFQRGWALAEASADGMAQVALGAVESDALLKLAKFPSAAEVAVRSLAAARNAGLGASFRASVLAANAAEALLALGRTADAAALIDPLTAGPPDRDHWVVHQMRAEIDLLRGDILAATGRHQQISSFSAADSTENAVYLAQQAAELALWAGRPADALGGVRQVVPLFQAPYLIMLCGRLLAAGMQACADLAEQARARRDPVAAEDAVAAAGSLARWVDQMDGSPFTDQPFVATIPAERATWEAERTRAAGDTDPAAWAAAAKTWDGLGCPHRAAYAWWRQAEAQLEAGQPTTAAATALRSAAAAADGHAPLLAQICTLADRARISLHPSAAVVSKAPLQDEARVPYGLTGRELAVLRLVAAGRSNAQIGAELFISRGTAAVHVTHVLRKLGVTSRVQAAALAERAGLLDGQRP